MQPVPRTVTEVGNEAAVSRPLSDFGNEAALVLLGGPGSGKTTEFEREAKVTGAKYLTARRFLRTGDASLRGKTLFLDGLDEVRVGKPDPRRPLDKILTRLEALGRPRFRLSCRGADWFGRNDRVNLKEVSSDGAVRVVGLDPLSEAQIEELVGRQLDSADAAVFLRKARESDLFAMLRSPQGLTILVEAFGAGGVAWPRSRREAFEKACRRLTAERNDEHRLGHPDRPGADEILRAAGEIAAVLLLADAAGCSQRPDEDSPDWPALQDFGFPSADSAAAAAALSSRLFTSGNEDEQFAPVHRRIAEFLAARRLADRIEAGLPVGRVLALITTAEGSVPTTLRGLAAWLAAHCRPARIALLDRDPVGIAAYGDTHDFSSGEKLGLLRAMRNREPEVGAGRFSEDVVRSLAVPEMAPALREALESADRGASAQVVACMVLRALTLADPMPDFAGLLMEVVRDGTRWTGVNCDALDAFLHNCRDGSKRDAELRRLLQDIRDRAVADPDRQLLGTLLEGMYPDRLGPTELRDYLLHQPRQLIGRYWLFWRIGIEKEGRKDRIPELLDTLDGRLASLRPVLEAAEIEDLPVRLVAGAVEAQGDRVSVPRLYGWLRIAADYRWDSTEAAEDGGDSERRIRSWLAQHPSLVKKLWLEGLETCPESDEFRFLVRELLATLGDSLPDDFGRFCLDRAAEIAEKRPLQAAWLVEQVVQRAPQEGISVEELMERFRGNEKWERQLPGLLASPLPARKFSRSRNKKIRTEDRRKREARWESLVRSEEKALRENRASPALLHELALQYLVSSGDYLFVPETGWRFSDPALRAAALEGLQGAPFRDDVPHEALWDLHEKGEQHFLAWPFLAGLDILERKEPERLETLDEVRQRTALAFHFLSPNNRLQPPGWYRALVASRPEITAETLVRWARIEIAKGSESVPHLDRLLHDEDHATVAHHAALPLLRGFPVRSRGAQLRVLDQLLWTAIRRADRGGLLRIVARKVASKAMAAGQRAHWLAAGLVAAPEEYRESFERYSRDEEVVREAAIFFCSDHHAPFPDGPTDTGTLRLLISRFGAMFPPEEDEDLPEGALPQGRILGLADHAANKTARLIHELGSRTEPDAASALVSLPAEPTLARWKRTLQAALDQHRTAARDASFRHPAAEQVADALRGGLPASAADLAALVRQHLDDLAAAFAGGDENGWRPFWNEDSYGRADRPKPEGSCRDALLEALRRRLDARIRVSSEARHAGGARSDLVVRCNGFAVPIEIKREGHPALWTAVSEQLLPKYTTLPAAAGRGIYLVLWFGASGLRRPRTGGPPPGTPEELQRRLEESLDPHEAGRVDVRVLDVRPPSASKAAPTPKGRARD